MAESELEWLNAVLSRRNRMDNSVDEAGCFTASFLNKVRDSLDRDNEELLELARRCQRLQEQLCTSNDDERFLIEAKQFLEKNAVAVQPNVDERRTETKENKDCTEEETKELGVKLVTVAELDTVPKYMKGRITLAEVNEIVRAFSECLQYKHDLMRRPYQKLANKEKDQVVKWKEQGSDQSTLFCLESEVRDRLSDRNKKNLKVVLPCLRHVRRLKESREKGTVKLFPLQFSL